MQGENAGDSQPNVVLILADDMGYGDLSCLNDNSRIPTPHMDAVAESGLTFTDGHASSSVCTPSRYGILTGRYAWRGRLQRSVLWPFARPLIEEGRHTLPDMLRGRGYHTACIGKWHLGMRWPFREPVNTDFIMPRDRDEISRISRLVDYTRPISAGPLDWGFDSYFGVDVPNFPPYCFIEGDRTMGVPEAMKPDEMFGLPGAMLEGWKLEEIMPTLTDRCVDYIDERARGDEPFFLYFSMTAPHTPIAPLPEFVGASDAGVYGDFVCQLDDSVGRITAALRRHGIDDNTMVIVASDNGSPGRDGSLAQPGTVLERFGHNPSWRLRGMKADTWDGGHRVPFLVQWPDRVAAGAECGEMVTLMDIMATLAEIAGADLPDGAAPDSVSILPYLTGDEAASPVRERLVHHGYDGLFGMRCGPWKLIDGTGSGGFSPDPPTTIDSSPGQLYHMGEDFEERRNLYSERPDVVRDLRHLLADARFDACGGGCDV